MRNQPFIQACGRFRGGLVRAATALFAAAMVGIPGCASHTATGPVAQTPQPSATVLLAGSARYEQKVKQLPITPDQAYARVCAERDRRNVLGLDVCNTQCLPAALVGEEYEFPQPRKYNANHEFKAFCVNGRTGKVGFIENTRPAAH